MTSLSKNKDFSKLQALLTAVEHQSGDIITRQGEPAQYFYVITFGYAKILRYAAKSATLLLEILGPGDVIGDLSFILAAHPYSVCALTPLKTLRGDRRDYNLLQQGQNHLIQNNLERIGQSAETYLKLLDLQYDLSVEERLNTFFSRLCKRFGEPVENGIKIPFHLDRMDLALAVSCRTETVIRVMRKWQKSGLMDSLEDGFLIHKTEHPLTGGKCGWLQDQCSEFCGAGPCRK